MKSYWPPVGILNWSPTPLGSHAPQRDPSPFHSRLVGLFRDGCSVTHPGRARVCHFSLRQGFDAPRNERIRLDGHGTIEHAAAVSASSVEYSLLRGPGVVRVSAGVRAHDLGWSAPVLVRLSATSPVILDIRKVLLSAGWISASTTLFSQLRRVLVIVATPPTAPTPMKTPG